MEDAAAMIRESNPDFRILQIGADAEFQPMNDNPALVRLFVDASG